MLNFFKILLITFLFTPLWTTTLWAEEVKVTSTSMTAADLKKEVHFIGDAKVVQGKSWIHGDEIIVYFDENNETEKYEAIGTVTFEVDRVESFYKGSADKVTYFPVESKYILTGKAIVDDLINKRHVNGDEIVLDIVTGNANVKGSTKKPVKFIFNTKEKK
jgi:lipopolysaccharide export system protein LptA